MTNVHSNTSPGTTGTGTSASLASGAALRLAAEHGGPDRLDVTGLAAAVNERKSADPATSAGVIAELEAMMTPVQRGQFAAALDRPPANDNPATPGPDPVQLGLDLGQMALDLTGIVDPTPISDGSNAAISLGRSIGSLFFGDWSDAAGHALNAGISAVGIIPALGDVAKAGKIGKWAQTVSDAVSAVAHNPALRQTLEPALREISGLVDRIPQSALDALPSSARESVERMKGQLDEFFGRGTRAADEAAQAGVHSARVGRNSVEWTTDANGYPTHVTAELSELQPPGSRRGASELEAQDTVRERGLNDDDAGHVIGHRFLGDQGTRNMFPQNFNFNRSAYKKMENEWADWIEHGATVRADVTLMGGTPERPDRIGVAYDVVNAAGETVFHREVRFRNQAGQSFDRLDAAEIANRMQR